MTSHAVGEAIVLLDATSLMRIGMDRAMIGATVVARAFGIADDEANPPSSMMVAGGESLRPMSPCHVDVSVSAAAYTVRWVARRSALVGWSASGGDEVGVASFEVTVVRGGGTLARTTTAMSLVLTIAEIAALGAGPIRFEVVEQGIVPSRAALFTLNA
ncbi:MAG: hypothetical protein LH466_05630 [Sphingomonas bacterium]|nr:hypothetical protein [Sphingomonas bacterium]